MGEIESNFATRNGRILVECIQFLDHQRVALARCIAARTTQRRKLTQSEAYFGSRAIALAMLS